MFKVVMIPILASWVGMSNRGKCRWKPFVVATIAAYCLFVVARDMFAMSELDSYRRLLADNNPDPSGDAAYFAARPAYSGNPLMSSQRPFRDEAIREAKRHIPLVDGTPYDEEKLAQDPYGVKLVVLRHRVDRYGFLDGLFEGSWLSTIPIVGFFAYVGSDISAANDAAHAFEKIQRGEALTRDEAVKATLWTEEQNMRKSGTGWYTFGSLIKKIIAFIMTFGIIYVFIADKKREKKKSCRQNKCEYSTEELDTNDRERISQANIEEEFLRYLFSMLAKLAKADGRIEEEEVRVAEKLFNHFDFALRQRAFCSRVFNEAKNNSRTIYWYAEQFHRVSDVETCIFVYEILWDVACADGWLHPSEKKILHDVCSCLNISSQYFDINYRRRRGVFIEGDKWNESRDARQGQERTRNERQSYVSGKTSLSEAYEILECGQSASMDELKAAYRRIAKRYHPDLLRANGVPEAMIKEATERMAQVNAAWEDIRRARSV